MQVIKLTDKDMNTAFINVFYVLKKIEERESILLRNMRLF